MMSDASPSNDPTDEAIEALFAARRDADILKVIEKHPLILMPTALGRLKIIADAMPSEALRNKTLNLIAFLENKAKHRKSLVHERRPEAERENEANAKATGSAVALLEAVAAQFSDDEATAWATIQCSIGYMIHEFLGVFVPEPENTAILFLERGLEKFDKSSDPNAWAIFQVALGSAYGRRVNGNIQEDNELSIAAFENALTVFNRDHNPRMWAVALRNIASTYIRRDGPDSQESINKAITCCQEALTVISREDEPIGWGLAWLNLGIAYLHHSQLDNSEGIEAALPCFRNALRIYTQDNYRERWSSAILYLGWAYLHRKKDDPSANIEEAIICFEKIQHETNWERHARKMWLQLCRQLGNAYLRRLPGDSKENVECAIHAFERALNSWHASDDAAIRLDLYDSLASAYMKRKEGVAKDNAEKAITILQQNLESRDQKRDAGGWADTKATLGAAYIHFLVHDPNCDVDFAIQAYKDALSVTSKTDAPFKWAGIWANLGDAYTVRQKGDGAENLTLAIRAYEQAFSVGTRLFEPTELVRWRMNLVRALLRVGRERWPEALQVLDTLRDESSTRFAELITPQSQMAMLSALGEAGRLSAFVAAQCGDISGAVERLEAARATNLRELMGYRESILASVRDDICQNIVSSRERILNLYSEIAPPLGTTGSRSFSLIAEELRQARSELAAALKQAGLADSGVFNITSILESIPAGSVMIAPVPTEFGGIILVVPSASKFLDQRHCISCPGLTDIAVGHQTAMWLSAYFTAVGEVRRKRATSVQYAVMSFWDRLVSRCITAAKNRSLTPLIEGLGTATRGVVALLYRRLIAYKRTASDSAVVASSWDTASSALDDLLIWLGTEVMAPALARIDELRQATHMDDLPSENLRLLIMPTAELSLLPLHAASVNHAEHSHAVIEDYVVSYTPSVYALKAVQDKMQHASNQKSERRLLALINPTKDLTWSEELEAPLLNGLFSEPHSRVILLRENARKDALIEQAPTCTHLHLSCHGRFDWRSPEHSGLILADGVILSIREIAALLNLDTCRWASLSACETGLSDIQIAPEEFIGQVAAFLQAGASSVTATFWAIDDRRTALLMGRAYDQHIRSGKTPAEAVREAVLWLRGSPEGIQAETYGISRSEKRKSSVSLRFAKPAAFTSSPRTPSQRKSEHLAVSPLYWAAFATWGL